MNTALQYNPHLNAFSKNWIWFLLCGIALVILGVMAVTFSTFTTLISVIFIAALILTSGVVIIIDSFATWWGQWKGFSLHFIMGALYTIAGIVLLKNPIMASVSLTLLLAMLYIIVGGFRIIYSLSLRMPRWGWSFFSGLLAVLLGVLILLEWPMSSLFIIGLFVGIDLMIAGWVYMMAAISARNVAESVK